MRASHDLSFLARTKAEGGSEDIRYARSKVCVRGSIETFIRPFTRVVSCGSVWSGPVARSVKYFFSPRSARDRRDKTTIYANTALALHACLAQALHRVVSQGRILRQTQVSTATQTRPCTRGTPGWCGTRCTRSSAAATWPTRSRRRPG